MFNGIIEYLGTVSAVAPYGQGKILSIESGRLSDRMRPGDSLAVNGVCLTIIGIKDDLVELEAVAETLSKTNLGELCPGSLVNLERPLPAEGRVHGHWVAGHVDSTTRIVKIRKLPESTLMSFELDDETRPFIVPRGSVAVDGVSLTVARLERTAFTCSLIEFTLSHTNLGTRKLGQRVNVETDMIGKYVVSTLERMKSQGGGLSEEKLRLWGY
ncbi:MAG TPA: riboflavin synthase [archaeon]|nr:riboflavin synthase [archaeon]